MRTQEAILQSRKKQEEWRQRNRERVNAQARERRKQNPDKPRAAERAWRNNHPEIVLAERVRNRASHLLADRIWHLKTKYGITIDDFEAMKRDQKGLCALCGKVLQGPQTHVDHCHATGKVRGILCHHCNTGLGNLKDDPILLRKAADYIEAHR